VCISCCNIFRRDSHHQCQSVDVISTIKDLDYIVTRARENIVHLLFIELYRSRIGLS